MKIIHPARYTLIFASLLPSYLFAGSVNGAKSGDPGTDLRPKCDYRRVTLNKCDANVQKNLRENCYVVIHDKNSPQSSVCTWQSCAGLSLVAEKPKLRVVQQSPKIFELDEYGIKSRVTAPNLPTSWNCSLTECLPKADPFSGSVSMQKDFNGNFESAKAFPRTYMTLGEALDLKERTSPQGSAALENARLLLRRPEVDSVMRANPYYSCAAGTKVKFWVERKSTTSSIWSKTTGLDGSTEYTVDAASWKDACRKNRSLDGAGFVYRCTTEQGESLQEESTPLIVMDFYFSNKWNSTWNKFRSNNWRGDCPAKIMEFKKGNNFKWRCRNDSTGETQE